MCSTDVPKKDAINKLYREVPVSCWDELYEKYETYYKTKHQWVFRGHRKSSWKLRTSLERAIIDFRNHGDASSEDEKDAAYKDTSKQGLGEKRWGVVAIEKRHRISQNNSQRCFTLV